MQVTVRAAKPADSKFIVDWWLGSYWDSALARSMSERLYRARWFHLTRQMVETLPCFVLVEESEPEIILGWLCHEGPALHYVFVREDFRRMGFAKRLLAAPPVSLVTYTARTTIWQQLAQKLARGLAYDPTLCWRHFGDSRKAA